MDFVFIIIYIFFHPQTDCFVLSEFFSVAWHAGRSKPGSKPVQLYVRLNLRPSGPHWLREFLRYLFSNNISIYIYIHTNTTHIHTHKYTRTYIHTHTHIFIYIQIHTYIYDRGWEVYPQLCPWCNCHRRRKWTRRHEFKSWTRLIAFHIAQIPLGKVWIQLFSLQLWVNSRRD